MIPLFGRPVPELSLIANDGIDCIYSGHSHRILEWNETLLSPPKLQVYADAIHRKGATLSSLRGWYSSTDMQAKKINALCTMSTNGFNL